MRLSVVMSVFNDAAFVGRAAASVLGQTHREFEFVIVNDGSTDGSTEILRALAAADPRVRLVEQENRGLVTSLNRGFAIAAGDVVARMDGDDECLPRRFEAQLAFLDAHPDHGVVGCQTVNIDADGHELYLTNNYPRDFEGFCAAMEGKPLMSHPGSMMRRAAFERVGGYRSLFRHCEDYDLWLRLSEVTRLCSLDEILLRYRRTGDQVTTRHVLPMAIGAAVAWEAHLARRAGRGDPTEALAALPDAAHLAQLDAVFGDPGVSARVRERAVPQLIFSVPALASGGARLLGDHIADGGDRRLATRTVARLVRHGEWRGAGQLAASLSRSYLASAAR